MGAAVEQSTSPWRWRALVAAVAGLIVIAFYMECRQGQTQRDDVARALACALGPPPVAPGDVVARYRKLHALARERGKAHPQICRNTFLNASAYHGNASSHSLQRKLERVATLLAADDAHLDEAQLIDELQGLVEAADPAR